MRATTAQRTSRNVNRQSTAALEQLKVRCIDLRTALTVELLPEELKRRLGFTAPLVD